MYAYHAAPWSDYFLDDDRDKGCQNKGVEYLLTQDISAFHFLLICKQFKKHNSTLTILGHRM